ncbi:p450 domain-containing protein [Cephalotus follicularis]|uniref:p450 domain-containing protein n=1 Tax=Cephalotus follicularis TaxID=3775 RepID=A0A1Q3C8C2_CEPFO|nr:p450 domain-containing protein [Cephalotus follicularis]
MLRSKKHIAFLKAKRKEEKKKKTNKLSDCPVIVMENQYYYFAFFFTFIFFIFMVVKIVREPRTKNSTPKLPPGPRKVPVIGNIHQLLGSLPHHTLRDLAKKYGPLMHLQVGEVSTVVVSSSEMAEKVMKNHGIVFAYKPSLMGTTIMSYNNSDIAFSPYGDYWRQIRKIATMELLGANRVQMFRSIREEEASNFIETISSCNGLPINLSERLFSLAYSITSKAAFGKKCNEEDQETFISIVNKGTTLISGFSIADAYPSIKVLETISGLRPKFEKLFKMADRILQNILNEHRGRHAETETNLVDVLLKIQQEGGLQFPLTDDNIKAVILNIFSAGSETSSATVEWAFCEMLKNPRLMKEAQNEVRRVFYDKKTVDETRIHELKLINSIIKESLRLHPPLPLIPRASGEECEIDGYTIPVKSRVFVNAWAIGREPTYWSEAETFQPERFLNNSIEYKGTDFQFIPFGAGRRICPGMSYALPNIQLPLAQMLYHFDWKLPNDMKPEELDMTEEFGLSVKRKKDLFVIPMLYHHP